VTNAHTNLSEDVNETPRLIANTIASSGSVEHVKLVNAELLSACMLRGFS